MKVRDNSSLSEPQLLSGQWWHCSANDGEAVLHLDNLAILSGPGTQLPSVNYSPQSPQPGTSFSQGHPQVSSATTVLDVQQLHAALQALTHRVGSPEHISPQSPAALEDCSTSPMPLPVHPMTLQDEIEDVISQLSVSIVNMSVQRRPLNRSAVLASKN